MALPHRLLLGTAAAVVILLLSRTCRNRGLPAPPLRLVLAALIAWLLIGGLSLNGLPRPAPLWFGLADDLLLGFAALRLGLWATLELPSGLGWGRRPPRLLLQLLMLGAGAAYTVVLLRQQARIDLVGLVTTSAVLTAVVGFAAQGLLKDLIAGLQLQVGDDFRVGDWISVGDGVQGIVETLSWRDTRLRTVDGIRLVVPNSHVTAEVIANKAVYGTVSDRFAVGLDYSIAPQRARHLLATVLHDHPRVLAEPPPRVRIQDFGESAILYELQVWQREPGQAAQLDLRSELLEQIWYAVHRSGWTIPYPVRELLPRRRAQTPAAGPGPSSQRATAVLARNSLLAVLSAQQQAQLVEAGQTRRFGPGETVVREGEGGDSLFLLLAGRVAVWKRRDDGSDDNRDLLVSELGSGEVFGEMTLFLDAPRSATVRALEECDLLELHRRDFQPLVQSNPSLLEQLADQVSARQEQLQALVEAGDQAPRQTLLSTMRRLLQGLAINPPGPP